MHYLSRVASVVALALSTTALSGCYAPPVAAVTADQTVPPAVAMAAPDQTPTYPPAYPPAAGVAPAYLPTGVAAPVANSAPTPLTPYNPDAVSPQYGSTAPAARKQQ
jgi:hypothetical protein